MSSDEEISLSALFRVYENERVLIDHTTGPWVAPLASAGLVDIGSTEGPIKCLEAKLSKRGFAIVKAATKQLTPTKAENLTSPAEHYDASQPGEPPLRVHSGHTFDADGCSIREGKLRLWCVSSVYPFYCTEMWVSLKDVAKALRDADAELPT